MSVSPANLVAHTTYQLAGSGSLPAGLAPTAVQHAYGFDQIALAGGVTGNGAGQTIAIVDAYDDPNIATDLAAFDTQFGLPAPPSFSKVYAGGTAPATSSGWSLEIALDVEWAHAVAPAANLVLVEAKSSDDSDLMSAVDAARNLAGVSVVSMSWGTDEYSGELAYDSHFSTPAHHQGITFVAASGDNAAPGLWPAFSPNVLSVGGTTLNLTDGNYGSETAWLDSGGGKSQYEQEPSFQQGVQSTGSRESPDVAYDANPNTGFSAYDSVGQSNPWQVVGGTSAAAPQWAALLAIADQGRALLGEGTLSGAQSNVYQLPAADFHDVIRGSNGFPATVGYDLATGLGTPIANLVIAGLIGNVTITPAVSASTGGGQTTTVGQAFAQDLELTVVDQTGKPLPGAAVTFTAPSSGASASFPDGTSASTDVNGRVNLPVTANDVAGSYSITASVAGVSGAVTFNLTNAPGAPASVTAVSGNGQQATVGGAFQAVIALVEDQYGNAVPGATVAFAAPGTGASAAFVGGATVVANSQGEASESLQANTVAGSYSVTAGVAGASTSAVFQLTNLPGAPDHLTATAGGGQQATVATAFVQPLSAAVTDQYGNPTPGVTVSFSQPLNGARAVLALPYVVTNSQGIASESVTAGKVAGDYGVLATVVGLAELAAFELDNQPGAPVAITAASGSGQQVVIGAGFAHPLSVVVADQFGNGVPGVNVTYAAPALGASAVLGNGGQTVTGSSGQASLSAVANEQAGNYTVIATVSGVPGAANFSLANGATNASTTLVASNNATAALGQTVSLTATVSSDSLGAAPPTGDVTFYDGSTLLGVASLAFENGSDQATFRTQNLAAGSHLITAIYSGDSNDLGSQQTVTETIIPLPTSSVTPLATVSLPAFTVSWSGDDSGGPGISGYDVLVSDNGGGYSTWLSDTSQTSAQFQGVLGHTYSFIVVAIDALGDRQPMPGAAQATTAAIAKDANGLYVAAVYQEVLGRLPDPSGMDYWTSQLDSGTPEGMVAASIVHSAEYYANEVIRPAYLKYLGRAADDAGVAWWTAQFKSGMTDEQFQAGLAASPEFYATSGGNDAAWIAALYQALLGRNVDPTTQAGLENELANGATRGQVALSLATGQEHLVDQITADYQRYLNRAPDPTGLAYWFSAFNQGQTDEDLITGFVGSKEFYDQATSAVV